MTKLAKKKPRGERKLGAFFIWGNLERLQCEKITQMVGFGRESTQREKALIQVKDLE